MPPLTHVSPHFRHIRRLRTHAHIPRHPDPTPSSALYDSTINNLKINPSTRIIYQGFTGKAATLNAEQNIQYGTNVVGGVTPGKTGQHLNLPLYPSVAEAARALRPDATSVFVAAEYAAAAIEEAIAAEIPLIVAVAEHVPLHDMLRVHSILRTQSASRLVGANCPGIVNPRAHCRIGFMPHPSFLPGSVGIVAKSGTLGYEAVASTTRVGLGQSLVVGMGGDAVAGTNQVDAVRVFLEDPETEAVVVIGEVGGATELEVADLVAGYRREGGRKPVMALVAGECAVEGRVMGHAGAFRGVGEPSVGDKVKALEAAEVVMVQHPGQFGAGLMRLLGRPLPREPVMGMGPNGPAQRRGMHTMVRRRPGTAVPPTLRQGRRSLYTKDPAVAEKILAVRIQPDVVGGGCHHTWLTAMQYVSEDPKSNLRVTTEPPTTPTFGFGITIDRATRRPAFIYTPHGSDKTLTHPFEFTDRSPDILQPFLGLNLPRFEQQGASRYDSLTLQEFELFAASMRRAFLKLKAYALFFDHVSPEYGIHLDSGVLLHTDNTVPDPVELALTWRPEELQAATHGIVYVTLPGKGRIGTLVNGAGLAMNTVDYLTLRGGSVANFMDTGGKATGWTVVEGLRTVLADTRVKAVIVNIFGGLTDCRMIAEGILMAYKELEMGSLGVPLVVRLRGTNEDVGQALIRESGLPVLAYDDLDEAVDKIIELAGKE